MNILGDEIWTNSSLLNKYSLGTLSFKEISYEEYFVQVFILRLRTVAGLWILSKLIPKKIVVNGFAGVICLLLGAILALAILENGVWGVLFIVCALLPHGIFYALAYTIWNYVQKNTYGSYAADKERKIRHLSTLLILMLTVIGCICEAYISPVLIENVIKL